MAQNRAYVVKEVLRRHATFHGVAEVTCGHAVPLGVAPLAVNAVQPDAQLHGASEPAVDAGTVGEVDVVVDVEGDRDSTALGLESFLVWETLPGHVTVFTLR